MKNILLLIGSGIFEVLGCYLFYLALNQRMGPLGYVLGVVSLAVFALLISLVDLGNASRAYAAYGGIYVLVSLAWMGLVERQSPSLWDYGGVALCLIGTAVIMVGKLPR